MITLKEFAKRENISYEAVRQQVKRYELELQDHLFTNGRTRLLDEVAEEFLLAKKKKHAVVVQKYDHKAEIEQLKLEKEQLLLQLNVVQNQLIESQQLLLEKTEENTELKLQLLSAPPAEVEKYKSIPKWKKRLLGID